MRVESVDQGYCESISSYPYSYQKHVNSKIETNSSTITNSSYLPNYNASVHKSRRKRSAKNSALKNNLYCTERDNLNSLSKNFTPKAGTSGICSEEFSLSWDVHVYLKRLMLLKILLKIFSLWEIFQ